ncbi:caspase-6 isoform X2 [Hyla sarda]|uniref:caspase-6 isoform X2 n=1 Tax=Hyla sarda TaxID=327740 RepID=UPI0024C219F0|nr:caspase-6 isoform X2 [Hyla sarda]XP_056420689.1 caspase-6 isoform X2 [Hyla sarda]
MIGSQEQDPREEVTKPSAEQQSVLDSQRKRPMPMVHTLKASRPRVTNTAPTDVSNERVLPGKGPGQEEIDSRKIPDNKDEEAGITETDGFYDTFQALDPAAEYNMKHTRRGLALIFNHDWFYWQLKLLERRGTDTDRDNLYRRLSDLGFEVRAYNNLKAAEIHEKVHEAASSDHNDTDCFLCVFLSHGEDSHVFAYDEKIEIQELTSPFKGNNCRSLVGKPKIFIIQACRGTQHDLPVIPTDCTDSREDISQVNTTEVDAASVYTLPAGADFIMCYSVAEGYYSHRETINGSWYIQDLCEALKKYGRELEFTELLTLVNRKVSLRAVENCNDRNAIGKKQVPCFASMLTKKLYLRPK